VYGRPGGHHPAKRFPHRVQIEVVVGHSPSLITTAYDSRPAEDPDSGLDIARDFSETILRRLVLEAFPSMDGGEKPLGCREFPKVYSSYRRINTEVSWRESCAVSSVRRQGRSLA